MVIQYLHLLFLMNQLIIVFLYFKTLEIFVNHFIKHNKLIYKHNNKFIHIIVIVVNLEKQEI